MTTVHPVCLLGFSAFEREALAVHFRLASRRTPAYSLVDTLAQARFAVVDADATAACSEVALQRRQGDSVYIGHRAPDGALARLPRPIDALAALRELDAALLLRVSTAPQGTPPASQPATPPAMPRLSAVPKEDFRDTHASTEPSALPTASLSELADLFPDRQEDARPTPASEVWDALIVDDSEIAQRFLERCLADLGLRAQSVATSQAALAFLAEHRVRLALLDVELGDDSHTDGLALCQHIKREMKPAPTVAFVTAHHSSIDRVRGSLAGADAHLGKPLQKSELADLVARLVRSAPKRRRRRPRA
ncbi:MAG: response regulator [Burkholderiaceae bacterium]